jgi:TorA maturation chaperone TorD
MTQKTNPEIPEAIQIMCSLFWGPDLESCHQMLEGDFFRPFETLLTKPDMKSTIALDHIKLIINKFDTDQSLFDHLNECYVRFFVNSKEGITAPLYQSCYEYENAPMMGAPAIKMMDRFKSKNLSMENRLHEPPDHIAVELEYLFFLMQEDDVDQNEIASFAKQTMLPWVQIFTQRLGSKTDECRFYFSASEILIQLLKIIQS